MQKQIQNTIEKVSNSFPSLFSREDVIKLLTDLNAEMQEESPKPQIDGDTLLTTFRQMLSEKDWSDVVDSDDIELSLSYNNQIEIESVPIDEDFLIRSAVDTLEALWDVLTFDPLEGEED
tara:strand:- start:301 stop:660 length:360 start_codon:yes stop_codon:yes gene_type:complete